MLDTVEKVSLKDESFTSNKLQFYDVFSMQAVMRSSSEYNKEFTTYSNYLRLEKKQIGKYN